MRSKRVVIISDMHCGHVVGLTPPNWQQSITEEDHNWDKCALLQREIWKFFVQTQKSLGIIDLLIVNGDSIDGRGEKSFGTELITSDRFKQAEMASYAIKQLRAKHIVMTYGTPYHTGSGEDIESIIAQEVKAEKIGSHEWIDINGVVFDCKHHIGSSSVPHGRHTAAAKERLWNLLWSEHEEQPKANVIVRSHVHYFDYCGEAHWLAFTTPALQGMGSKFGSRKCSGHVDVGMVHFDIESNGSYSWQPHILKIPNQKAQALKF
jgi:hypothetical protein